MTRTSKPVTELRKGDKVEVGDNEMRTVARIGEKGWWPNSFFVYFQEGDWACVKDKVSVWVTQ